VTGDWYSKARFSVWATVFLTLRAQRRAEQNSVSDPSRFEEDFKRDFVQRAILIGDREVLQVRAVENGVQLANASDKLLLQNP